MRTLLISTALVAATSLGAVAQTTSNTAAATTNNSAAATTSADSSSTNAMSGGFLTSADPSDLQASNLIGMDVYATGGQDAPQQVKKVPDGWKDIGSIGDLVLNRQGQVQAVVVNIGGFLGIGDHTVALDMNGLTLVKKTDTQNQYDFVIAVNQTKKALENAPTYKTPDQKRQQDQVNAQPSGNAGGTAGTATMGGATGTGMAAAPAAGASGNASSAPATDTAQNQQNPSPAQQGFKPLQAQNVTADTLQNASVYQKSSNSKIGEVSKVLMDDQGKMTKAVVSTGGILGIGSKDVVLQASQMKLMQSDNGKTIRVYVAMNQDQLKSLPKYKG